MPTRCLLKLGRCCDERPYQGAQALGCPQGVDPRTWTQYTSAQESVAANRQVIAAAQLALNGVIEERNVGQRTTLDVLNAQNDVISAKINLATSERDVVVASYAILSAMHR